MLKKILLIIALILAVGITVVWWYGASTAENGADITAQSENQAVMGIKKRISP